MPIENDKSPTSLLPITTQCDKDNALNIHNIVTSLLESEVTADTTFDWCVKFMKLHFTHLHPSKHNIFSPNSITSEPIDGMFLSPSLLHNFIDTETHGRVSEELHNFFVDILNFNGEFSPLKQQWGDTLSILLV